MRICGHLRRTRIYSNFFFFLRNIFLSWRDRDGVGRLEQYQACLSLSLCQNVPPFITRIPLPPLPPPRQPVPRLSSLLTPPHPPSCSPPPAPPHPRPLDQSSSVPLLPWTGNANVPSCTSPLPQSSQRLSWLTHPPPTTALLLSLSQTRALFPNEAAQVEPTLSTETAVVPMNSAV